MCTSVCNSKINITGHFACAGRPLISLSAQNKRWAQLEMGGGAPGPGCPWLSKWAAGHLACIHHLLGCLGSPHL